MCGATATQNQLQAEDVATLQEYNDMLKTQYAKQGELYSQVSSVLDPILKAGPGQEGFSAAEKNNLNAQAVAGTATNYAGAAKAVNEELGAEGGGNAPISSGAADQMREEVANSAARTESQQEAQIEESNYATGRQNFDTALQGEMSIAAGENPLGYASAVTSSENAAANQAEQIAQEDNSWYNAATGAAGGIASHVVDMNPRGIFG